MRKVEIVVLGGCHVVGYPIGKTEAFPTLLSELINGTVVAQVPHLTLARLPDQLALVDAQQPSHVVFQLGNYEFSDSLQHTLRLFGQQRVAHSLAKALSKPPSPGGSPAATGPPAGALAYGRVVALGALLALLWLGSGAYRRSFRALNACMRRHPNTAFIFLSPFPCLAPNANALRRFGGWLLRHRLPALPNVHWLDTHQLVRPERQLFVDQSHFNKHAHRALAYGLAASFLTHIEYML